MTNDAFIGNPGPWDGFADHRREAVGLVEQLTLEEKVSLVSVALAASPDAPADAHGSAAYCPGVPRLGIPAWDESDASLGVTNPDGVRDEPDSTAFPSLTAVGATFDPAAAHAMGQALGEESRQKGFSVQLAGGINLVRDPRGGRNFEYVSEDVLLSGLIAGAHVRGIQERGVVSTLKHFAINPLERGRVMVSSDISEKNLRESDLLAFEIANNVGKPRSIMPGYNMVNKKHAGENAFLLQEVLKGDWGFGGFVMSDWGATHSTHHAVWAGLDRQSGYDLDVAHYFGEPLRTAVEQGTVSAARLDDMVIRILTALISVGALTERRRPTDVDYPAHRAVARDVAEKSVVLLRNVDDVLPLAAQGGRIVVLGRTAHLGVLSGGGSSTVRPADHHTSEGLETPQIEFPKVHHGPSPLAAMQARFDQREIVDLTGDAVDDVATGVRADDTVVVFAEKWATEGRDAQDLLLGDGQDDLIEQVAALARHTIVVLETASAVLMPWTDRVDAIVAAWYGGSGGAEAIAAILSGDTAPSGRLPVTFPVSETDLPRPDLIDPDDTTSFPGLAREGGYDSVDFDIEGADVGYRWFARQSLPVAYPFGHGLTYTTFTYSDIEADLDAELRPTVTLTVTNTGSRAGVDVPQLYIAPATNPRDSSQYRLVAWARTDLAAGESTRVRLTAHHPQTYAHYDPEGARWTLPAGDYQIRLARSATDPVHHERIHIDVRTWSYPHPVA